MKDNYFYLTALIEGSSKEITSLYNEQFPKVKSFILKNKGTSEDAQDIFQKALLQIAVRYKKEKFEIKSTFEGYLFTVCKNLWRRELNKSKKKVTNSEVVELVGESDDMALAVLEQKRWELFKESMALISDNCKQILKLFFAKVSYKDIVEKMQYNSETVARQRVFKCKNKLMEIVKKDSRFKGLKEI